MFSFAFFSKLCLMSFVFLKIGLLFFGGGYATIPVMHRELVNNYHFLTNQEFIEGIAMSQLTPGPIAILATFAGYRILGLVGAFVGTFVMFLPGTVLMLVISRQYEKIKDSTFLKKVLNTVIPVVIGLLVASAYQLGHSVISGKADFALFFVALFLLLRYKINPVILIVLSGLLGLFSVIR